MKPRKHFIPIRFCIIHHICLGFAADFFRKQGDQNFFLSLSTSCSLYRPNVGVGDLKYMLREYRNAQLTEIVTVFIDWIVVGFSLTTEQSFLSLNYHFFSPN